MRNLVNRGLGDDDKTQYSASGASLPMISIDRARYQLTVRGILVDFVKFSTAIYAFSNGWFHIPATLKEFALSLENMCTDEGTKETGTFTTDENIIFEAYWRTLVLNRYSYAIARSAAPESWGRAAKEWCEGDMSLPVVLPALYNFQGTDLEQFKNNVQESIPSRKFILTETMRMGMATSLVQEGDMICIFLSCSVPVLLRPAASGTENHFILVGDVYVHGLMDGGAMGRPEYEIRDFVLV